MCRTVTLTVKSKDLEKVLGSLKLNKEFAENTTLTLTVDIEDTKENYKILCKSQEILDWDFTSYLEEKEEENSSKPSSIVNNIEEAIKSVRESIFDKTKLIKEDNKILRNHTKDIIQNYIKTYDDIIEFILLSWRLSSKFNVYSLDLVKDYIIPGIIQNQTDISEVKSLDRKIIQLITSYYSGVRTEEVLNDVIQKIQDSWETLGSIPNVESLILLLFGPIDNKKEND